MRWFARLLVIALSVTLALLFSIKRPTAAAQEDDPAAQQVLTMINTWRIQQGLWPLRENPVLDQMAFDQASYIDSLSQIPIEPQIHMDANGNTPPTRAKLPQYNWPSYGDKQFTAVGEIAYVGFSAQTAFNFWNTSKIHHDTALNSAYREIGVAAIKHPLGHMYFVDFGSRPDVLPVIPDVKDNLLYLSNERYSGAKSPWMGNAIQVRLFDALGRPLNANWIPWQSQIALPPGAGSEVYVEYLDNSSVMVLSPVLLDTQSTVVLPTLTPTLIPSATPSSTLTPTFTPTPPPNIFNALAATNTTTPLFNPTATRTPIPSPASPSSDNVLLLYDAHSFTLINSTSKPINVQNVVFVGTNGSFAVTKWATQWLSGTLTALAGSDCLQVWSWLETTAPAKPSRCRQLRSVLTIAPDKLFWKQGDFTAQIQGQTLATCHQTDTQCTFAVPTA